MTSDERYAALPTTAETIAAKHGWNYSVVCQIIRTGMTGMEGARTHEIAEDLAEEMGLDFADVWD